ncbi:MAG: AEC family transporter [Desulfovibrionaceae bacterium]|nr:AEC family transporter [Desulfovibrionaceae bacterium]
MVFLNALQSMLSITLITFLGYFLSRRGMIHREVEDFIPKFNLNVVVPLYLMGAVMEHFTHDQFLSLIKASILPFLSIVVSFWLFWLIGLALRIDRKHLGLAATAAATSNTIFIGIPVNNALFGEAGLIHLLLYFISNTLFFWTFGVWAISREGTVDGKRPSTLDVVKHVFSPPLLGTLAGIAIVILDIPMPRLVGDTCNLLGGICSPLALIFVGCLLSHVDWKTVHMGRDLMLTILGRILLTPLVTIAVVHLTPIDVDELTRNIYIVQAGLPCMTNIAIISAYYGADREFGSIFVSISTIVGMISVPIWMTLLTSLM